MIVIPGVFSNTAGCLRTRVDAESQAYVEMVVMMLSTMRDIYQASVRPYSIGNALTYNRNWGMRERNMVYFVGWCLMWCWAILSCPHTRDYRICLSGQ